LPNVPIMGPRVLLAWPGEYAFGLHGAAFTNPLGREVGLWLGLSSHFDRPTWSTRVYRQLRQDLPGLAEAEKVSGRASFATDVLARS
jgi:hypothetical protein